MENTMYDIGNDAIGQDQALALQSQIMLYVREALTYDRGYCVFAVKNLGTFEFEVYYSNGNNIDVQYEETREETVDRILYTIDCEEFIRIRGNKQSINDVIRYLYNYIVGVISSNIMVEKYNIVDKTDIFRQDLYVQ